MKEFLLRRAWKNDAFKSIREAGLNPLSFEWGEETTDYLAQKYPVSIIRYVGTDFYFKFDRTREGEFSCRFYPGSQGLRQGSVAVYEWAHTLPQFRQWLSYLKEDVGPDLWEQIKEYTPDETFIGMAEISNAPFSNSEAENIIASLDKLQAQIEENFSLQGDQLAYIKQQMEYLKDGAKRLGRKDWINILISVIVNIGLTLALDPEKAQLLWGLVKSCFAALLPLPVP